MLLYNGPTCGVFGLYALNYFSHVSEEHTRIFLRPDNIYYIITDNGALAASEGPQFTITKLVKYTQVYRDN